MLVDQEHLTTAEQKDLYTTIKNTKEVARAMKALGKQMEKSFAWLMSARHILSDQK